MMASNNFLRLTALYFSVTLAAAFSNGHMLSTSSSSAAAASLSTSSTSLKAGITEYLDDQNYRTMIQNSEKDLVLVDACAQWCGPCKLIDPFLVESAETYKDSLQVVKLDVDAEGIKDVKIELMLQGALPKALPHLILFHKGQAVAVHTGVLKQEKLNTFIEENLQLVASAATTEAPATASAKAVNQKEERDVVGEATNKGLISFGRSQPDNYALAGLSM